MVPSSEIAVGQSPCFLGIPVSKGCEELEKLIVEEQKCLQAKSKPNKKEDEWKIVLTTDFLFLLSSIIFCSVF